MLEWDKYIAVADRFQYKASWQDREDLKQDIIVKLADVARNNGHGPFSEGAMVRVASYTVMSYWRDRQRKPNILSLNSELYDDDGGSIELLETIADDHAIDLDAWCDARTWLLGCPGRLVTVAHKKLNGVPLTNADMIYLCKWRKKERVRLA
jgi:DNA-directed RNA polymerase specialized sigma24 family protein